VIIPAHDRIDDRSSTPAAVIEKNPMAILFPAYIQTWALFLPEGRSGYKPMPLLFETRLPTPFHKLHQINPLQFFNHLVLLLTDFFSN
jgi:hypothetical protein